MNLRLERRPAVDDTILGQLFLDGVFYCFTLERGHVAIPHGTFSVTITPSQRFGRLLPLIEVPGRSGIRIHPGNSQSDTEGCILVGNEINGVHLSESRLAMAALQSTLARELAFGRSVWLTVQDAPAKPALNT